MAKLKGQAQGIASSLAQQIGLGMKPGGVN